MTGNYRRTIFLAGSMLLAGLVVAGCSSGDTSTDQAASSGSGVSREGVTAAPEKAPDQQQADGATAKESPDLSVDQRSIIYTGAMSVRVRNVTAAASQVTGFAQAAGGFIGSDDRDRGSGSDTATMQLRVPADKFGSVVDQLSKLGTEESRKISTEDVTEQTVDLDARISVQQARVDSGRKLLASAKSLADLVMLEKEVATREADLASLQAKKRHLVDLVALSTISVTLLNEQAPAPKPKEAPHGFLGGLAGGWHALLASLKVVLTVIGALLPWAFVIGVPAWAVYQLIRRMRRGRGSPRTESGGGGAGPAAPPPPQHKKNTARREGSFHKILKQ
ncbi:DUF4349 domain-containing protein [Actinoplanes sp. NPDC051411]|uniref:DUF4349 domain-containing protein n=1 Tax=Actinoplanes sp. NPDC051411 TaxID=3155522 RepID=UPI0034451FDE